jgi:hypothetical protein
MKNEHESILKKLGSIESAVPHNHIDASFLFERQDTTTGNARRYRMARYEARGPCVPRHSHPPGENWSARKENDARQVGKATMEEARNAGG